MTRIGPVLRRTPKIAALALILGVAALIVPNSATQPTYSSLVRMQTAEGTDLGKLAHGKNIVTILAVGSDARPGENMLHTRSDALHLIFMDTKTHAAADIGVPRDSWVSIPGHGSNRINAALFYGGPQLLGQVVGNLIGVRPDYVFVTRFTYFQHMVRDIGGIKVNNPVAFNDPEIWPRGFKKGRIHLSGLTALKFARIRHTLPHGDFDRSANQDRVIRGIQEKLHRKRADPGFIAKGVLSVMQNLQTDLSPSQLFQLAHAVADVDPGNVTSCVIAGRGEVIGGADVENPDFAMAKRLGNAARNDATLPRHC
ncbi:MAG: LCP family protein [Nocardioidaceae bacterium]|nr:LCP family protein [Nocardioidaceae bacterium]MCL2613536.1 LCP family protein [Nocardioidaceae bacterium]